MASIPIIPTVVWERHIEHLRQHCEKWITEYEFQKHFEETEPLDGFRRYKKREVFFYRPL